MSVIEKKTVLKVDGGGILSPAGFKAGGLHIGLRYEKKDFGVVYSETPAQSAAVYTKSHFQAAPLKVTQESIGAGGILQAIVVNSAIANACTGEQGLKDAYETRKMIADRFRLPEAYVAVASTGVIGECLQMDKMKKGCSEISVHGDYNSAKSFQQAILTTDTVEKSSCVEVMIDGRTVTIGGAAKGSGMIHPNMGTMLGFITTDAAISSPVLQSALKTAINTSFNQITVDGETSTNDMVIVMANGKAGNKPLNENHPDWGHFQEALSLLCEDLAKQIARDGEGATKLVEVEVEGAHSTAAAMVIAKKIVGSSLVKTAIYGADPNWGRIVGAMGHSEVPLSPLTCDIYIGEECVFSNGTPQLFNEKSVSDYMKKEEHVVIKVSLQDGTGEGRAWGCDLTYDYVKINASYRT
ncbi:bifunctional ornithine acetyltransferase/N-acetylglutamate synthase [Rossellomorea aquimaris]|uniref:bifunctional ornithine acetyltransferase/N-acetylglutamate synthase n=1 Tax=Rossellomorea aquimaris TaxID=189382 RepID=UPI001CD1FECF|nr:bifunctional ornithine acetyltransferase/N-acetylglutamate synthase [Rossellomorea aquimaris]MCA1056150.1 bifunctional ornithine acetyltransferase/N-acetylglutamate synthase [Rossellomorea aquimaris]